MNYRSPLTRRLAWGMMMLVTLTSAPSIEARPPRAKVAVAVIESVDSARWDLRFSPVDYSPEGWPPPRVHWSQITCILREGQPVEASTLVKGMILRFSYRTPFFGSPFATEITILSQTP